MAQEADNGGTEMKDSAYVTTASISTESPTYQSEAQAAVSVSEDTIGTLIGTKMIQSLWIDSSLVVPLSFSPLGGRDFLP